MNPTILEIQVRYQETDQMGRVYHGNYFTWYDMARTEYLREHGCSYRELETAGIFFVVAETTNKYFASVAFDDQVIIKTYLTELRAVTVRFRYEVINKSTGQKVAEGTTKLGTVAKSGKIVKIPPHVFDLLQAEVAELADARDSKSRTLYGCVGSSPTFGTK